MEHSNYLSTVNLKKRLLKSNLLENKCSECGIGPEWNNKPLSLQIDHKNGVRDDNRIENLRILCPNCHAQTETYSGKKNSETQKKEKEFRKTEGLRKLREHSLTRVKNDWDNIDLAGMYAEIGSCLGVAKKLGNVGDTTVRKRLKRLGVLIK